MAGATNGGAGGGMKGFYVALGVLAVIGVGALGYVLTRPATVAIPVNVAVQPSDTLGFSGYVLGSPDAPVEITEFADYQCPYCQTFAILQMPAIQERLIKTGRLRFRYRDYPLEMHNFSRLAAHAAACADDQKKYWPMHDRIYEGQGDWAFSTDAGSIFRKYAGEVGLDAGAYDQCMKSAKFAGRVQASFDLAQRYGVNSTPTLMIGDRLWTGRIDSDAITRIVDSLSPRPSVPRADTAAAPK